MPIPSGVTCAWVGTNATIPAGWTRSTAYDARYVQQIANSGTAPGSTGGANTHNHNANGGATHCHTYGSHSHSWGATGSTLPPCNSSRSRKIGPAFSLRVSHNHTMSEGGHGALATCVAGATAWSTVTAEAPFLEVIWIKSDGTPSGLPNNALALFNGGAPTGWAEYVNARNRIWKGAAGGGDGGGTGGTGDSHTHALASHTHARTASHTHTVTSGCTSVATCLGDVTGCGTAFVNPHNHGGPASGSSAFGGTATCASSDATGTGDVTAPWQKMLGIQNTSGSPSTPTNVICLWDGALGAIPNGWRLCDGGGGTPNLAQGKFVRGANGSAEVGNTGGAATHNHGSGSHSHADAGSAHAHTQPALCVNATTRPGVAGGPCCIVNWAGAHTHTAAAGCSSSVAGGSTTARTITSAANTDNSPVWTGVAYIQFLFNAVTATVAITVTPAVQKKVAANKALVVSVTPTQSRLIKSGGFTAAVAVGVTVSFAAVHLHPIGVPTQQFKRAPQSGWIRRP